MKALIMAREADKIRKVIATDTDLIMQRIKLNAKEGKDYAVFHITGVDMCGEINVTSELIGTLKKLGYDVQIRNCGGILRLQW